MLCSSYKNQCFLFTSYICIYFTYIYIPENIQNNFWNYLLLCIFYVSYCFPFCYSLSFRLDTFLRYLGNVKWVKVKVKVAQSSPTLQPHGLYSPWNSPYQNTGWIAIPFSRGSSQPRNQTRVSCIAGRFITKWATREALR